MHCGCMVHPRLFSFPLRQRTIEQLPQRILVAEAVNCFGELSVTRNVSPSVRIRESPSEKVLLWRITKDNSIRIRISTICRYVHASSVCTKGHFVPVLGNSVHAKAHKRSIWVFCNGPRNIMNPLIVPTGHRNYSRTEYIPGYNSMITTVSFLFSHKLSESSSRIHVVSP